MLGHPNMPVENNVIFVRKAMNNYRGYPMTKKSNQNDSNPQKLFLLSTICNFPIFDIMPRFFKISTKHGTSQFNIEMLRDISPVISNFIDQNPNENTYFLNINDEENILNKFEQLFQGKIVYFEEDDLPSSQRITKILQIKRCPNYLKPESLRTNEFDSSGLSISSNSSNLKSGVIIYQNHFYEYLKKQELRTFTIKTNKNEYKCNIFGIYSSDVIRSIITKDPTITEYSINIDDEFDEFQPICDLFNFESVDITNENMDFLKDMAEELQIHYIINQLDNYINKYQQITEKIDEQSTLIESIDHLFDLLYNIDNIGIEKVKISIIQSKWSQTEEDVQELAAFILYVISSTTRFHKEMVNLLVELNKEANDTNKLNILQPFIVNKLMNLFYRQLQEKPLKTGLLPKNCPITIENGKHISPFIRLLYKKGIIPSTFIFNSLQNYNCSNRIVNAFFLPEIIKFNTPDVFLKKVENKSMGNITFKRKGRYIGHNLFIKKYLPDKIDLYEQMLDNMEPDDQLTKSLRYDDVDTLQLIITSNEADIEKTFVPYNIFDDLDENPTILNYAALYGSIKCFKYLLLNNGKIDESTLYFAIYGGNIEIIKIVDQRWSDELFDLNGVNNGKYKFVNKAIEGYLNKSILGNNVLCYDHKNNDNIIMSTITMHRNGLFDWIFEKRFVSKGIIGNDLNRIAIFSALSGNAHSLIEIIDKGYDLSSYKAILDASKNGFYKLTQLLVHIIDQKSSSSSSKNFYKNSNNELNDLALSSVNFGNLNIFKLLAKQMNQDEINDAILKAILMNHKKIVEYYFNNLDTNKKNQLKTNKQFLIEALAKSIKRNDEKWFNFILENIKSIEPNILSNIVNLEQLLNYSCSYSNSIVTETITNEILKINPKYDFSSAFIKASSSGAMNICQYFANKKIYINYEKLSMEVSELGSVDEELFLMIFNNANESTKEKFLNCINQAIKKKNKKLVEFIIKRKIPTESELFEAVSTRDIEIVNLILKYNSKPSFVNQKTMEGTVLHAAVTNDDIEIVKRLLSVQGIDPSLKNRRNDSALLIAINHNNNEIVEEIIKFYDNENNQFNSWVFYDCLFFLLSQIHQMHNKPGFPWNSVIRLLKIKSIDPNFSSVTTFLIEACKSNKYEIVQELLELEKIDVNKYDSRDYYTPLMVSIQQSNVQIAKLLINHPKTDLNLKNIDDETALTMAVKKNEIEIINLLINNEKFDPIESKLNYAFIISESTFSEVFLSHPKLDVNQSFRIEFEYENPRPGTAQQLKSIEMTALTYSVKINDNVKINQILNHKSFNRDRSDIIEAIFNAAKNNNVIIFKQLLQLINNDINILNKNDKSLLFVAASKQSGAIIDDLFANPSFDPIKQNILLSFVRSYSGSFKIKPKIRKGDEIIPRLSLDLVNEENMTDKNSRIEIMEKIYNYKNIDFNINILPNGKSFFTIINENYDEIGDVCNFLIEHGADPTLPDDNNTLPFDTAILLRSFNLVNALLNTNKIDLSHKFENGNTYLHFAAKCSNPPIVDLLINQKLFDINITNENGETPLMIASRNRRADIVKCLFDHDDLDYLHCNNEGVDALRIVRALPQEEENDAKKNKRSYLQKLVHLINQYTFGGFR